MEYASNYWRKIGKSQHVTGWTWNSLGFWPNMIKKTPRTLILSTQTVLEVASEDSPKIVRDFTYFDLWLGFKVVGVAWSRIFIFNCWKFLVGFVCVHNKPLTTQSVKVMAFCFPGWIFWCVQQRCYLMERFAEPTNARRWSAGGVPESGEGGSNDSDLVMTCSSWRRTQCGLLMNF